MRRYFSNQNIKRLIRSIGFPIIYIINCLNTKELITLNQGSTQWEASIL